MLHDDEIIVTFFGSLSLEEGRRWRPAGALTLRHFFYTWFVFKLGVLADNFLPILCVEEVLCGGNVKRRMDQGCWRADGLKASNVLSKRWNVEETK